MFFGIWFNIKFEFVSYKTQILRFSVRRMQWRAELHKSDKKLEGKHDERFHNRQIWQVAMTYQIRPGS